jgi:hypothetical protein
MGNVVSVLGRNRNRARLYMAEFNTTKTNKEFTLRPSRTYAGDAYKGGYSDHLPAFLKLTK